MTAAVVASHHDPGRARRPRAAETSTRPDGPRLREPTRRPDHGHPRHDVAGSFFAAVQSRVRRNPVRLFDDQKDRTGHDAAASGVLGNRYLYGGRLHLARFVQFPIQRTRSRNTKCLPGPFTPGRRFVAALRCHGGNTTEQSPNSVHGTASTVAGNGQIPIGIRRFEQDSRSAHTGSVLV
jgi:hypothetical protein